ncbi:MAG TPA: response regulator [Candidatus Binataceae bacterium]|nr:response regulator [Candidatus Binataceae bacterium]
MSVRALVVDDQPVIRGNLRLRLARLGCEVREAENAYQGLTVYQEFIPQIVTLDIVMPVVNGFTAIELLREIRKSGNQTDVVVISSRLAAREEFVKEGAIEFIAKPFEKFDGLIRKLEPLIQALDPENR